MVIRSRFALGGDATARHLMPGPICDLFERTMPIGTIALRRQFLKTDLPRADERRKPLDHLWFWVRPAFTSYSPNAHTHIIVTGHILLCSDDDDAYSECARSIRLFLDTAPYRAEQFQQLCRRVGYAA